MELDTAAAEEAVQAVLKINQPDITGSVVKEPTMALMVSAVIGAFTAKVAQAAQELSSSNTTTPQRRLYNAYVF